MSAVIRNLVARKRQREADNEAFELRRAEIVDAARGEKGEKGDVGPRPDHQWKGSKLRFEKPDGTWGDYVDLKGPKGEDGKRVVVLSGGGNSGAGLDVLPPATTGEPQAVAVMVGGAWVKMSWAAFSAVIAGTMDMGTPLSRRSDFVGTDVIYIGEAAPGAVETDSVWRIRKFTFSPDGDSIEVWAGGSPDFNQVWSDRATLTYS